MICRHGLGLLGSLLSSHFKDVKTEAKRGKHSLQIGSRNNGNTESSFQIPETVMFFTASWFFGWSMGEMFIS